MNKDHLNSLSDLSRRQFVSNAARTALGVSVLPLFAGKEVAAAPGKAKHCIFFYMSGGMTHLDTFDPKPGAETQGKTGVAKTPVAGINLSEYMPKLAAGFKDIALIRSMTQKTGDHRGGSYVMHTSYAPRSTIVHPTMGPWAQRLLGKSDNQLPDSVTIGGGAGPGAGFFGPSMSPLPIGDPMRGVQNAKPVVEEKDFDKRLKLMSTFNETFTQKFKTDEVKAYNEFYDETLKLMSSDDLEVFELAKEPNYQQKLEKYGNGRIGQGALLAKRLVANGVRHIEVTFGGWDMHNDLWGAIGDRAGAVDNAISALIEDLKAEGLFDSTLICLASEFGRTPNINANGGRDHHPRVFTTMFAGGGIQGGQVYGESDDKGIAVKENPCEPKDFNATVAYAMGLDLNEVVYAPSGRPFLVAGHKQDPKTNEILTEGQPIMPFFS
jgi:uncharacterized protein (DUF1501 family)